MKELMLIQTELKAPKSQRNNFGNYNYRSCEDILEALKPLLKKHECCLVITDNVHLIGDRYYIIANAVLTNKEGNQMQANAMAREPNDKKGMDFAQITGATSSYARKYALNGLFAIDDTKDADTMNNTNKSKQRKSVVRQSHAMATDKQVAILEKLLKKHGVYDESFDLSRLDAKTASEKIDEYINKSVPTNRVK